MQSSCGWQSSDDRHRGTETNCHRGTEALSIVATEAPSHREDLNNLYYSVLPWLCGDMGSVAIFALWLRGSVAPWLRGDSLRDSVALWRIISVPPCHYRGTIVVSFFAAPGAVVRYCSALMTI
jgi:hypothetical protein